MKRLVSFCILFWAVQICITSNAQSLRRQIFSYSETSIIRQYHDDDWICYSHGKKNQFFRVSPTGGMTPYMCLMEDKLKIMDFEILGDMVYFCGYLEDVKKSAVLGFFRADSLPNSAVKYDVFAELESFNKMDVFTAEGQIHVVMTAEGMLGYLHGYTIVDARKNTDGSWIYCVLNNERVKVKFDDVAVSENRVYFTARSDRDDVPEVINTTELWSFAKPNIYGVPVFISSHDIHLLYNWPVGPILIEHMNGDKVVMAARKYPNDLVSFCFDGIYFGYTCKILYDNSSEQRDVLDIKYNRYTHSSEVLTDRVSEGLLNSIVFTIHELRYFTPGTISLREFSGHDVQSLDFITTLPDFFVTSGHNTSNFLSVHKYDQPVTNECFPLYPIETNLITFNRKSIENNVKVTIYLREMSPMQTYYGDIQTISSCEQ